MMNFIKHDLPFVIGFVGLGAVVILMAGGVI